MGTVAGKVQARIRQVVTSYPLSSSESERERIPDQAAWGTTSGLSIVRQ